MAGGKRPLVDEVGLQTSGVPGAMRPELRQSIPVERLTLPSLCSMDTRYAFIISIVGYHPSPVCLAP